MLISENYRQLNAALHSARPDYGIGGARLAPMVEHLAATYKAESILDYGCGKGEMVKAMSAGWRSLVAEYDPALVGKDGQPEPADLVVCGDVMEHIEPECLELVIRDLRRVTRKVLFCNIATFPASKELADGRNAHLIIEDVRWWLPRFWHVFEPVSFVVKLRGIECLFRPC